MTWQGEAWPDVTELEQETRGASAGADCLIREEILPTRAPVPEQFQGVLTGFTLTDTTERRKPAGGFSSGFSSGLLGVCQAVGPIVGRRIPAGIARSCPFQLAASATAAARPALARPAPPAPTWSRRRGLRLATSRPRLAKCRGAGGWIGSRWGSCAGDRAVSDDGFSLRALYPLMTGQISAQNHAVVAGRCHVKGKSGVAYAVASISAVEGFACAAYAPIACHVVIFTTVDCDGAGFSFDVQQSGDWVQVAHLILLCGGRSPRLLGGFAGDAGAFAVVPTAAGAFAVHGAARGVHAAGIAFVAGGVVLHDHDAGGAEPAGAVSIPDAGHIARAVVVVGALGNNGCSVRQVCEEAVVGHVVVSLADAPNLPPRIANVNRKMQA